MIELARAQDEEVGDGTTSVIILAGEVMVAARPYIEKNIHPTVIVSAYFRALEDAVKILDSMATKVDI
jgi:T-complex protein 1 subunit gamma